MEIRAPMSVGLSCHRGINVGSTKAMARASKASKNVAVPIMRRALRWNHAKGKRSRRATICAALGAVPCGAACSATSDISHPDCRHGPWLWGLRLAVGIDGRGTAPSLGVQEARQALHQRQQGLPAAMDQKELFGHGSHVNRTPSRLD